MSWRTGKPTKPHEMISLRSPAEGGLGPKLKLTAKTVQTWWMPGLI